MIALAGCNLSSLRESFNKDEGKEVLAKAKFDRVLIDSTGELEVYASMNKVSPPNDAAILQFSDPFKELYLLVIREDKDEFSETMSQNRDQYMPYVKDSSSLLSVYGDYTAIRMAKNLQGGKDSLVAAKTVHGLPYRGYAVTGTDQKIPLFYMKGTYQGRHSLYQVIIWTMNSRRNLYEGVMKKMAESLQENAASE